MILAKPEMLIILLLERRVLPIGEDCCQIAPIAKFHLNFPHFPNLPIYS